MDHYGLGLETRGADFQIWGQWYFRWGNRLQIHTHGLQTEEIDLHNRGPCLDIEETDYKSVDKGFSKGICQVSLGALWIIEMLRSMNSLPHKTLRGNVKTTQCKYLMSEMCMKIYLNMDMRIQRYCESHGRTWTEPHRFFSLDCQRAFRLKQSQSKSQGLGLQVVSQTWEPRR